MDDVSFKAAYRAALSWQTERLAELLKAFNTQEELASLLGVTQSAISRWKSGQTLMGLDEYIHITSLVPEHTEELLGMKAKARESMSRMMQSVKSESRGKGGMPH